MSNRKKYDEVCMAASRKTTKIYSTSFSLGVRSLHRRFRDPIHAIYGFVRFADEIVDTFHDQQQAHQLARFREDTFKAINDQFSLNPILHSFQQVVHRFNIDQEHIETFLDSMEMDLKMSHHDTTSLEQYILGSAEVVGLMCLRVFCENDDALYNKLKPHAMSLGSAFQKVNFLRDLKEDGLELGRIYFPGTDLAAFTELQKKEIEQDIEREFEHALIGIKALPSGARSGVHLAYVYYRSLLKRIQLTPASCICQTRIRVPDSRKFQLLMVSYVQRKFRLL